MTSQLRDAVVAGVAAAGGDPRAGGAALDFSTRTPPMARRGEAGQHWTGNAEQAPQLPPPHTPLGTSTAGM